MPIREYALSSSYLVYQFSTHEIRALIEKEDKGSPYKALVVIPVILANLLAEGILVAESFALSQEELDRAWSKKFLKGPASSKPSTITKANLLVALRNICQVHIAPICFKVLAKHGVKGLREFGEIRFINITSIYPDILKTISSSLFLTE
jgi:hypothetical protein